MNLLDKIKLDITKKIKDIYNVDIEVSDIVYPPNSELGDLSLPCFKLAKELGKNPGEVAGKLVEKFSEQKVVFVSGVKTAGPYVNFTLDKAALAEELVNQISSLGDQFGAAEKQGKKILIEYSQPNTHKEFHVGHLRNLCLGNALQKILTAAGIEAIPITYVNDFGIHVAKTIWYAFYETKHNLDEIEKTETNKGQFLGKMYAAASQSLKENEVGQRLVGMIMKKIESRQGEEFEIWKQTRLWSMEQFEKIYQELDVNFEKSYYENEVVEEGSRMVKDLLAKGICRKSEGAVIADLEAYGLGVLVILRSDGTALYPVADLALAKAKNEDYHPDVSMVLVDIRQSLYFNQLFKIFELVGLEGQYQHLGYEFVKLPGGMISSRTGNVITYEELKEEGMAKTKDETRKRHADWPEEKINDTAWKILQGAIKFEMLKVGADQVITFDIDQALRFDGFTSAYLQYTYARIQSIIRKSETNFQLPPRPELGTKAITNYQLLSEPKEQNLILELAKYPEAIIKSGLNYDPSEIAKYLFELAQTFNDYYHSVQILKSEEKIRDVRLGLIGAVSQVIKNGLFLLGIDVLDEM